MSWLSILKSQQSHLFLFFQPSRFSMSVMKKHARAHKNRAFSIPKTSGNMFLDKASSVSVSSRCPHMKCLTAIPFFFFALKTCSRRKASRRSRVPSSLFLRKVDEGRQTSHPHSLKQLAALSISPYIHVHISTTVFLMPSCPARVFSRPRCAAFLVLSSPPCDCCPDGEQASRSPLRRGGLVSTRPPGRSPGAPLAHLRKRLQRRRRRRRIHHRHRRMVELCKRCCCCYGSSGSGGRSAKDPCGRSSWWRGRGCSVSEGSGGGSGVSPR